MSLGAFRGTRAAILAGADSAVEMKNGVAIGFGRVRAASVATADLVAVLNTDP
jgi:hypothetical protein